MTLEKPVIQPAPNTKIPSEPTPETLSGIPDLYYLELREERLRKQSMRSRTQGDILQWTTILEEPNPTTLSNLK